MLRNNKGFTMVEVIASFAVLSIISLSLLQMFITSTITNRKAFDMDKAISLCTEVSERLKNNPNPADILTSIGINYVVNPAKNAGQSAGTDIEYKRYLNNDWNLEEADDANIRFLLKVVAKAPDIDPNPQTKSYMPTPLWTGDISMTGTYNLYISNDSGDIRVNLAGYSNSTVQEASIVNGVLPIELVGAAGEEITLNVYNNADINVGGTLKGLEADIYICNVAESDVNFNPQSGISSDSYIDGKINNGNYYVYEIKVLKFKNGVEEQELTSNTVKKYYVSEN